MTFQPTHKEKTMLAEFYQQLFRLFATLFLLLALGASVFMAMIGAIFLLMSAMI